MEMSDDSPTEEETQALEPSNNAKNKHKPTSDLESDLETIMKTAKAEVNSASRAIACKSIYSTCYRSLTEYRLFQFSDPATVALEG
jgi:lipid II:glycine glycyltransferase (peptidoglycan interpeptide bridge formation enzyme)